METKTNQTTAWTKVKASVTTTKMTNPILKWVQEYMSKLVPCNTKKPIVLTIGDPVAYNGFGPNPNILEKLAEAFGEVNGYQDGSLDLKCRQYLAEISSNETHKITSDDVFLTSGCSAALYIMNLALADSGDTILMPQPGFPLMISICEARGVNFEMYKLLPEKDWEIDLEDLEEKLKKKPKFLLVNNPSNPVGSVWSAKHIKEVLQLANKYKVPIVSDEVYDDIVFKGVESISFAKLSEGQPVFLVSGFGKMSFATGWRMGWVTCYGNPALVAPVKKAIQKVGIYTLPPATPVQKQLPEFIEAAKAHLKVKVGEIQERVKILAEVLEGCPGVTMSQPKGTIYAVPSLKFENFEDIKTSREFAIKIYQEENVNLLPGALMGDDNTIRLVSLADQEAFRELGLRFKAFAERHSKKQA